VNSGAQFVTGAKFAVRGSATDPVGVQSINYFLDSTSGAPLGSGTDPIVIDTSQLSLGGHKVVVVATNLLGVSNDPNAPASSVSFNCPFRSDGQSSARALDRQRHAARQRQGYGQRKHGFECTR